MSDEQLLYITIDVVYIDSDIHTEDNILKWIHYENVLETCAHISFSMKTSRWICYTIEFIAEEEEVDIRANLAKLDKNSNSYNSLFSTWYKFKKVHILFSSLPLSLYDVIIYYFIWKII